MDPSWRYCELSADHLSSSQSVDFASRASKPSDVVLPQIISLPVCFAVTSLFGILIGSASEKIFGEFVWNPLDVMERLLETYNTHGMRAGIAFISIGFIIAQIGTNIAANSLSAGCDLTSIMPRYLNIRRGGYIAALVGFCICPWNFLKSSSNFTTVSLSFNILLISTSTADLDLVLPNFSTSRRTRSSCPRFAAS